MTKPYYIKLCFGNTIFPYLRLIVLVKQLLDDCLDYYSC